MPPPEYSIILPAYNEAAELPRTLAAVRAAMAACPQPGECVVVDNNSTDGTAEVATAHGADRVVGEPVNQIARARNAGAAAAKGHFLIFVDADTRIPARLLSATLEQLASGTCGGGGSVIRFEGPVTRLGRFGIGLWERISKRTRTAAGSYLFCRRELFAEVGGFDERLYAGEEVRLCRLLRRAARRRGMTFVILDQAPALTSARKLRWYSGPALLGWVLLMALLPVAVRSRRLCRFWYWRPGDA